jgi:hypothetical protein
MTVSELLRILLESDGPVCIDDLLDEASVHLPRRGSRWIATYRDETGRQVWKSTGLRNRAAAQIVADRLEAEARRKRATQIPFRKPTIRVRPGSGERGVGLLSQKEVAVLLRVSERAVREIERTAFEKIRNHPAMREFWSEWQGGKIDESDLDSDWYLNRSEIAAVLALARTFQERRVLRKVLELMSKS